MGLFDTVKKVVAGDEAHDAADSGNPLKIGGYAKATAPTAVNADGDRVNAWFDLNGRLMVAMDQGLSHASWPANEVPVRKLLNLGVQAAAVKLWPAVAGKYVNLLDMHFSTDTQLYAMLHQANKADYAAQVVADGAQHLYKCDEASGNITDSIGALTGVAIGTGHTYAAATIVGADGKAIGFNGTSQAFASVGAPASSTVGALEVWAYLDAASLGTSAILFSAADAATADNHMQLSIGTELKPGFLLKSGGINRLGASGDVPLTPYRWHHIVWQHDGSGLELYLDGVLQAITYSTGNASTVFWYDDIQAVADHLSIAVLKRSSSSNWFPGRLTMCAWYDANQTAAVWANHYALGAPLWGPHYFAAYTGVAGALRAPLQTEAAASIYFSTSAVGNTTMQLTGVEVTA